MDREGGSDRLEKRRRGPILFLRRHHERAWGADKAGDLDAVSSIVAYLEICLGSYLVVIQLVLSPHCIINLIYGALWCRPRPSLASCVSHVQSGDKLRQQCFFMWPLPLARDDALSISAAPQTAGPLGGREGASFRRKFSSSMMQRRWWQEIQQKRERCDGVKGELGG